MLTVTGDVIPARSANATVLRRGTSSSPTGPPPPTSAGATCCSSTWRRPCWRGAPHGRGDDLLWRRPQRGGLVYAGVSVAGLANNHLGNYGQAGAEETIRLLSSRGIAPAGLGHTAYRSVRGLRFAFLAYNGVGALVDRVAMAREIGAASGRTWWWCSSTGARSTCAPSAPRGGPDDPRDLGRAASPPGPT